MNAARYSCYLLRPPVRLLTRQRPIFVSKRHQSSPSKHDHHDHHDHHQDHSSDPYSALEKENPVLADFLRKRDARENTGKSSETDEAAFRSHLAGPRLASTSLLESPTIKSAEGYAPQPFSVPADRNPIAMAAKLDPKPQQRRRWERKMVIRTVQKRGRLTKEQRIRRTERHLINRSEWIKTSMKKLSPLANQIAGKRIEDAITQMRFSKKKAAISVRKSLEDARDMAVVTRGMGLANAEGRDLGKTELIRLKDGSRLKVEDRSQIYVDQAWVGRGPYGQDFSSRARGRQDKLRLPQTSISISLKEEATRIREHAEREVKRKNRKVWTPLPDRPITAQRQYYCW